MPDLPSRPVTVPPQRISGLLDRLAAAELHGDASVAVTGITHDSRAVRPGDLYVARGGAKTHGIEHVVAAVDAGAVAVLTDPAAAARAEQCSVPVVVVPDPRRVTGPAAAWVYGDPAASMQLLGVTGTNGKTTTAYFLDAGLRAAGRRSALIGTIETRVGDEAVPSARTTPEATELQALLAVMRERGVETVAMEVSSHALALDRVDGMTFDVAAFTNLSQDHLDFHADMAEYFAAKARLFSAALSRRAVIAVDDEWGRKLATVATVPVTTLGATAAAQWRRVDDPAAGRCRLSGPSGEAVELASSLAGSVNLANAALAYVVLVAAGVDSDRARDGIGSLPGIPGRMERVEAGQQFQVFVDYAHTPEALTGLLRSIRTTTAAPARVIVVVGCGGDRDRAKRPLMGKAAAEADIVVLTSDNPRSEDPAEILAAMRAGVPAGTNVESLLDRRAAIEHATRLARPHDVVVIAGKGHERGQEIAGQVLPFDDHIVAREALRHRQADAS